MTGRALTDLEVLHLDPRRDLERLRGALDQRLRAGQDPAALLRAVAERDPRALAELAVGPRALGGPLFTGAVLPLVGSLETVLPPRALYRRLAELSGPSGPLVLSEAIRRHPDESWIVDLSVRVEGPLAGFTHLCTFTSEDDLVAICERYVGTGHHQGLAKAAVALKRLEPLGALARHGVDGAAAFATAGLIEAGLPVIPCLAATWGPDLVPLLLRVIHHLPDRAALVAFSRQTRDLPRVQRALAPLLTG